SPAERARLVAHGITDETAQRYLVWRRSVLLVLSVPAVVIAGLYQVDALANDFAQFTDFGLVVFGVAMLSIHVMPLATLAAFVCWSRPRLSRGVMRYGWLIAFFAPVVTALFPIDWIISLDKLGAAEHARLPERVLRFL